MGACGAAYEAGPWLNEAKKTGHDIKIKLVDKVAMDRSGAVAQALSAIDT
jgi:adenylylsulfate reductase, subunit A